MFYYDGPGEFSPAGLSKLSEFPGLQACKRYMQVPELPDSTDHYFFPRHFMQDYKALPVFDDLVDTDTGILKTGFLSR